MIDTTWFQDKKAAYFTLGCKLNFSETSSIARTLQEFGVREVRRGEVADLCIINTCSVTEVADKKCRQAIHAAVRRHPGARVIVIGCHAQLKGQDIARIDGVDLVLGAEQKGELCSILPGWMSLSPIRRLPPWSYPPSRRSDPLRPVAAGETVPAIF